MNGYRYTPPRPRNYCRLCSRDFASLESFDRHKTGDHARARRCLDAGELHAQGGWVEDEKGRWSDPRSQRQAARARGYFHGNLSVRHTLAEAASA